jgi:hypothetical protein
MRKNVPVSISEGYLDNRIKPIVDKNPWLLKMDFVRMSSEERIRFWRGAEDYTEEGNLRVVIRKHKITTVYIANFDGGDIDLVLSNKPVEGLNGYFKDVVKPTQEERDYFEMIHGVRIPWSEDQPLVIEEN